MKTTRRRCFPYLFPLLVGLLSVTGLSAQLTTARFFGDNMVLQRNQNTHVWGTAPPGTAVNVSFHTQLSLAFADADGRWKAELGALPAGGPYELQVSTAAESILYENVMVGEVWICAGQSNMVWRLENIPTGEAEIAASNWPNIRLFKTPDQLSTVPETDFPTGEWKVSSPATSGAFSAVAYFFGRKLHQDLDVPIGLITIAWGGTQIMTWISPEGLAAFDDLAPELDQLQFVDLDHVRDSIAQAQAAWEEHLDAADLGLQAGWHQDNFDWPDWPGTLLPKPWTLYPTPSGAGSYWLKRDFELTARQADHDATLRLGRLGDSDETWINGQRVGTTEHQPDQARVYSVAADVLRAGTNVVTIRVRNQGHEERLYPPGDELSIGGDPWQVSLSGHWHRRSGTTTSFLPPPTLNPNDHPSLIYHGMVHPFTGLAMAGVIWYQGESDTGDPFYYRDKQIQIIDDWRDKWQIGDFAFITTQLPYFRTTVSTPGASSWATLRESQTYTLKRDHTALVTMIDSGDPTNIHPYNKFLTGTRLADHALRLNYGVSNNSRGPDYMLDFRSGNAIHVVFRTYGAALYSDQPNDLRAFAIAGEDGQFVWAEAEILNNSTVRVWHPGVPDPKYVRYAWSDNPGFVNLFDVNGLPARPFRTDELVTPYE